MKPPVLPIRGALVLLLATAAALTTAAQSAAPKPAVADEPITAIIDAFRSHRIVALGEGNHGNEQGHAFRLSLIRDPRFTAVVNDIVVEYGNARYQDLMDRFVSGEDIPATSLRRVWQDTTVPLITWDVPIYEEFFRAVRAVNATLPRSRQLRVLLGDPPIDWASVRNWEDVNRWESGRDEYPADLIRREVLAKQRRALLIFGGLHFQRKNLLTNYQMDDPRAQVIVSLLEKDNDQKPFTIWTSDIADLEKLQPGIGSWRTPSLVSLQGTILGASDFTSYYPFEIPRMPANGDRTPIPRDQWRSLRMEDQFDAVLYLGPLSTMTQARLSPALCADSDYMEMRLHRLALLPGSLVSVGAPSQTPVDRLKQYCASVRAK